MQICPYRIAKLFHCEIVDSKCVLISISFDELISRVRRVQFQWICLIGLRTYRTTNAEINHIKSLDITLTC